MRPDLAEIQKCCERVAASEGFGRVENLDEVIGFKRPYVAYPIPDLH